MSDEELNQAEEPEAQPVGDPEAMGGADEAAEDTGQTDQPAQQAEADQAPEAEATEAGGEMAAADADAPEAEQTEPAEAPAEGAEQAAPDPEASEPEALEAEADQPATEPEQVEQIDLKRLLGRKVGMTQIFDDTGAAVPVTLIEAGPCYITQIREHRTDGYTAVQLGYGEAKPRRLTGGQLGHLKRNDLPPLKHLREFRVRKVGELQEGARLTVSVFEVGDRVDVVGTSKGRGFAGAIKRHGFHRGPKTHGQSDRERAPGSHGATSTPGRVFKGSRGPGHMGAARVSAQNLHVALVDPEHNLLGVRGSVPGRKGGLLMVKERRKQ